MIVLGESDLSFLHGYAKTVSVVSLAVDLSGIG